MGLIDWVIVAVYLVGTMAAGVAMRRFLALALRLRPPPRLPEALFGQPGPCLRGWPGRVAPAGLRSPRGGSPRGCSLAGVLRRVAPGLVPRLPPVMSMLARCPVHPSRLLDGVCDAGFSGTTAAVPRVAS